MRSALLGAMCHLGAIPFVALFATRVEVGEVDRVIPILGYPAALILVVRRYTHRDEIVGPSSVITVDVEKDKPSSLD
jgi:hypothetical protein